MSDVPRILIFDSPEAEQRLKILYGDKGWQIYTPSNMKEGLGLLNTCDIDVALLNAASEGDVFAALHELIRQAPDVRVIMVAEYASLDRAIKALREGAHGYVLKPFSRNALSKSIEDAVTQRRLIVTDRRRAESELKEFKDELDRLVHEKSLEIIQSTAKLKAELESLKAEGESFRSLFETSQDAIFLKDRNLRYTMVNPAMERLFGLEGRVLVGKTDGELFGEEAGKLMRESDELALEGEIVEKEQMIPIRGVPRILHLLEVPLRDGSGEMKGLWGSVRDVTERKRVEKQVEASQRMESVSTLAGGVAHNFNNLLTGILGTVSLLLMDMDPADAKYRKLKKVEEYVRNGVDLTRQLLGFAREGKYELKVLDLNRVVEKTATIFAKTKKEVVIHREWEPHLWLIKGDESQIEQALLNLYVNAWQAMPGGGELTIKTENIFCEKPPPRNYTMKPGRYVQVSVRDTGVGMDPSILERIFEPFFTTREVGKGIGLGLAAVYGIVKNHGGFINASSETGRGATFEILLPAFEEEPKKCLPDIQHHTPEL
jgi:two-component system, cell cycle sensor histidine kinase and response regulator CckA